MKNYRLMLLGTVATGLGLMAASGAMAGDVEKEVAMVGFVNRVVAIQDDGASTSISHLDNHISESRFGIEASAKSENLTIGANFIWLFQANDGSAMTQANYGTGSNSADTVRHSEVYFETKYGTLWLGHGETATDGIGTTDLSGTNDASANGDIVNLALNFVNSNQGGGTGGTGGPYSSVSVGSVLPNFDGQGRLNRIKYSTPTIAGFRLDVENIHGGVFDTALWYEGNMLDTDIAAAIGYTDLSGVGNTNFEVAGSISALHSSGINATVSYGLSRSEAAAGVGATPNNFYAKLGYQADFFSIGKTYLSVDYQNAEDNGADGNDATKWGVQAAQDLEAYGAQVYAGFHNIELDTAVGGATYEDINAGFVGAMVNF